MSIMSILNSAQPLYSKEMLAGKGNGADEAQAFGQSLALRIAQASGLNAAKGTAEGAPTGAQGADAQTLAPQGEKQAQLRRLEEALGGTVSYMTEKYGKDAGVALVGLVYKSIGDGEITEESLGNAFLDVTRFIDKNFGTAEGDAFLQHLNGSLNDSLNAFFENGMSEKFLAVTIPAGGVGAPVGQEAMAGVNAQYVQNILDMLEKARAASSTEPDPANPYAPLHDKVTGLVQDNWV